MDSGPLQYTDTKWTEVQLPETTKRFRIEKHIWEPWKKDIHSPNMPQFLKMFKKKDGRQRIIGDDGTRYLQVDETDEREYYFCVKRGQDKYPDVGDIVKTHLGKSKKIAATWITPDHRATGIIYFEN